MQISIALPPTPDTVALAVRAEELGYERVWLYDTPALQLDVWMCLSMCAAATERVGLGPAVLVPSLRHPLVTASAIATLEQVAPGRNAYAVGSGFTGRRALGQKPMKWTDVIDYVRQVQGLLRGDAVEIDGALVEMLHWPDQAPPRPIEVPWLIGANGPKGIAAAHELGAGVFTSSATGGFAWSALLSFGTVLDAAEDLDSPRVLEAAGPAAAVAYHALYEQRHPYLQSLPRAAEWTAMIEALPHERRHLDLHRGHLTRVNDIDRTILTPPDAARLTRSGDVAATVQRLAEAAAAGVTEFVYQPAGPDPMREIEAFIEAARGRS